MNGSALLPEPGLQAAIMAAVQAYLDDEDRASSRHDVASLSAWRLAAREPILAVQFGRGLGWKGRN